MLNKGERVQSLPVGRQVQSLEFKVSSLPVGKKV